MSPRRSLGAVLVVLVLSAVIVPSDLAKDFGSGARVATVPRIAPSLVIWRSAIRRLPLPHRGCFKAASPRLEWTAVPCVTPPKVPYAPWLPGAPMPSTVGGGNDQIPTVGTSRITHAEGTFDFTGAGKSVPTGESAPTGGSGPVGQNVYSLQLNSNFFLLPTQAVNSTGCSNPCKGWVQFVYSSFYGTVNVEWWLVNWGASGCRTGWTKVDASCFQEGASASGVPQVPVSALGQVTLDGSVGSGYDSISFVTGGTAYGSSLGDPVALYGNWTDAEFKIGGDGFGTQASFAGNTTIGIRTSVDHGTPATAPTCAYNGFSTETNNLQFVNTPSATTTTLPGLESTQSNDSSLATMTGCAGAVTWGDAHLTTFVGTKYDFQARGEFLLAETGPGFVVQSRQVPWSANPNVSVNDAVATRMGNTRVAVCLPEGLQVNGKNTTINDGASLSLPGGIDISRANNVYLIRDAKGHSVRAVVWPSNIDVAVGLGQWPVDVHGLLANANDNINQLATRDGTVLTAPLSFNDLYNTYGNSWRLKKGDSVLCPAKVIDNSNPKQPFDAQSLPAEVARRARQMCVKRGVSASLLSDCTLDLAVIGKPSALSAYVGPANTATAINPQQRK